MIVPVPPRRTRTRANALARGFTLIELMIVVAIVGILAAIAYPSYGAYVTQTRRTDAQLSLLEARQAMERCRSTRYTYVGCALPRAGASVEGEYVLTLTPPATASTFTIVATPMPGGKQVGDVECAKLTINHLDQPKGLDSSDAETDACWN